MRPDEFLGSKTVRTRAAFTSLGLALLLACVEIPNEESNIVDPTSNAGGTTGTSGGSSATAGGSSSSSGGSGGSAVAGSTTGGTANGGSATGGSSSSSGGTSATSCPAVTTRAPSVCTGHTSVGAGTCSLITNFSYAAAISNEDGRSGGIFLFDDGTGMVASSVMNGVGYYSGGDQTGFGGGIVLSLNNDYCYDASYYDGISFTAYGSGKLAVAVRMEALDWDATYGDCADADPASGGSCPCGDFHQVVVDLAAGSTMHAFTWDEFVQQGWGAAATFDPSRIRSVTFQAYNPNYGTAFSTTFHVDDVHFVLSGGNTDSGCNYLSRCQDYCAADLANCPTQFSSDYGTNDDCMVACESMTLGMAGTNMGDTVECRLYYAGLATNDDPASCPSAAKSSSGYCQ